MSYWMCLKTQAQPVALVEQVRRTVIAIRISFNESGLSGLLATSNCNVLSSSFSVEVNLLKAIHLNNRTETFQRKQLRDHEVTGSKPVEVLSFSGFFTQLQKLRSQLRGS